MAGRSVAIQVNECPRCKQAHTHTVRADGARASNSQTTGQDFDLTFVCPNTKEPPNRITVTMGWIAALQGSPVRSAKDGRGYGNASRVPYQFPTLGVKRVREAGKG